jgi:ABC-type sugar transport system permease subunit
VTAVAAAAPDPVPAIAEDGAGRGRHTRPSATVRSRRRKQALLAYLLILPAMALFGVFSFYPFLRNFKLMLYETPPVPGLPPHYVGLHQIIPTITSTQFTQSLVTTILFVLLVVPLSLMLGLALAVAAHRKLKGMAVYRVIFSSTVVSSVAVASVVFGTLLNPVVGLLPWLGINPTPPALESTTWALPAVALITIWQFLGLSFIIMSAGLQSVPDELLEAARIDGASEFRIFFQVVLPISIAPLATLGILTFLASWNNFLWPLVVSSSERMYTLPVAVATFAVGQNATDYGLLMAGSTILVVPVLVVFLALQRYFQPGIAMTGLKG